MQNKGSWTLSFYDTMVKYELSKISKDLSLGGKKKQRARNILLTMCGTEENIKKLDKGLYEKYKTNYTAQQRKKYKQIKAKYKNKYLLKPKQTKVNKYYNTLKL